MLASLPLFVGSFSSPTEICLSPSLHVPGGSRANMIQKLLFEEDWVIAGWVTPGTEGSCQTETLPSSAPHPPCALHAKVLRADFILQL